MNIIMNNSSVHSFQLIDLNDLPKYSPWPNRLLGLSSWEQICRDKNFSLREYWEKWEYLRHNYEKQTFTNLSEALYYLLKITPQSFLFLFDKKIYFTENNDQFWDFIYSEVKIYLSQYLSIDDTLVELGCGWGRNLLFAFKMNLCKNAIGGDFSKDGLNLGNSLKKQFELPINFFHFDYYSPSTEFLYKLKDTIVFTHNSIEQISYLPEKSILALIKSQPRVVIHLEPIFEHQNENTLLSCIWKRYIEINDYNRNLLTVLKRFEKQGLLKIIDEKPHALGLNAFNPCSFIVWVPV